MADDSLPIRVLPRSSRNQVLGERDGAIAIKLQAPPVDGAANAALLRFLAQHLDVPQRRIALVSGQAARCKRIRVEGLTADQLRAALLA
jgi:uncharacterized protein (TIGR00251 family)